MNTIMWIVFAVVSFTCAVMVINNFVDNVFTKEKLEGVGKDMLVITDRKSGRVIHSIKIKELKTIVKNVNSLSIIYRNGKTLDIKGTTVNYTIDFK